MTEQFLFSLCLGTFACLMPASAYCLVMAHINGKSGPTAVPGTWDCAGMLLGLSGFLLIGFPAMMTALEWLFASPDDVVGILRSIGNTWTYIWFGYFAALFLLAGAMIFIRRKVTVIYQLEPELVADLVEEATKRTGREVRTHDDTLAVLPKPGERPAEIRIDTFRSARTVTLRWRHADRAVRRGVEAELDKLLADTASPPNPTTGWLMTVASCLSFLMLFCVLFVLVVAFE